MFTTLHALAQSAALHLMIAAEGDKLRVTLATKPAGKEAPKLLALVATPEEFDRDFADAVRTWSAPSTPLIEQASAAAAAAAETKALPDKTKPAKPETKPAPAKKPAAKVKQAKPAPAPKPAFAAKPAAKAKGDKPAAVDTPPDRDAVLADMRAYLAQLKGKASRVDFIKTAPTGRRYERLFESFNELVDAAKQASLPLDDATPNAEAGVADPALTGPGEASDTPASAPVAEAQAPVTLATLAAPPAGATNALFAGEPVLDDITSKPFVGTERGAPDGAIDDTDAGPVADISLF